MEVVKKLGPSAVLAVVGIRASEALGVTNRWYRLGLALAGSFGGIYLATRVKV